MKGKIVEYIPCLKYSVPIFVEQIYKLQRLEVSGVVRPLQWSLGVKGLTDTDTVCSKTISREVATSWLSHVCAGLHGACER